MEWKGKCSKFQVTKIAFSMLCPPIVKFDDFFFFPYWWWCLLPADSVGASLDSLTLGNDVMRQQLDSISQGKRKHPAFFAFGVGGAGGEGSYFGSLLNLVQRLQEVFKKKFVTN